MPYKAGASNEDILCGRSAQAYSEYLAQKLKPAHSLVNAACAGATVADLASPRIISGSQIPPQLDTAFAAVRPDLITLTIGANDVKYSEFINKCIEATCDTTENSAAFNALLAALKSNLYKAMNEINNRSGGQPPTVVLTGYYYPFSYACTAVVPQLTLSEVIWINQQVDKVQEAIHSVANSYYYTKYAQPNFLTHELCSVFPWIQGPGEAAPLHPNYQGQQAISNAIAWKLNPLTFGL